MGQRAQAAAATVLTASAAGPAPGGAPSEPGPDAYPELACLRDRLHAETLRQAERRAERLGTGADRALIAAGALGEEAYARALAASLGIGFEDFDTTPRTACPLADDDLIKAAAIGLVCLGAGDDRVWVVAPRHLAARRLVEFVGRRPALAGQFRLTTTARLDRFALRSAAATLKRRATNGLRERWPTMSAAPRQRRRYARPVVLGAAIVAGFALALPGLALTLEALLATFFIAWLALRLATALIPPPRLPVPRPQGDRALPVYTVLVALYREAQSVAGLLDAIAALDYPREKLDVILAVEADDKETRAAIARYAGPLAARIVVVPDGAPRTKPRALNAALAFARGRCTVVYDAEDRPEPDQLRCAIAAFDEADDRLACVQARLTVDNTDDGFLARMFTAEYAGQFDVFLDGLAAFALPLPLGGSSNHFATAVLHEVGGWDAWNVTEDADLGVRLARFGYRAATIDSTTHEEAPARFGPWLRQRTRWFKGWMQTWRVHMRAPRALWRDLGPRGFVAFQLVVGGNVLAALVHPVFMAAAIAAAVAGTPAWATDGEAAALAALYGLNILTGYASSTVLCSIGLSRRGLLRCAWVLLLMPLHWLLLSLAAWRALYQLIVAPSLWEKTEHGLARHSRRAARRVQALLELERELATMRAAGTIGNINRGERRAPWRPRAQR